MRLTSLFKKTTLFKEFARKVMSLHLRTTDKKKNTFKNRKKERTNGRLINAEH